MDAKLEPEAEELLDCYLSKQRQYKCPVTKAEKFFAAVRDGDFGYVQGVLSEEGDHSEIINCRDPWKRTPFTMAVRTGDLCEWNHDCYCSKVQHAVCTNKAVGHLY